MKTVPNPKYLPLIVAITGASGVAYGIKLLELLAELGYEAHLVMSKTAKVTLAFETDYTVKQVEKLAAKTYAENDMAAAISSGSFRTRGMVIAPCSIRSMSEIASGVTTSLVTRAADVILKERRKLVLMVRETPLHLGHLRSMVALAEMGAIIAPPMPAFYNKPKTVDDLIRHTAGRVLDLFDISHDFVDRWGEA